MIETDRDGEDTKCITSAEFFKLAEASLNEVVKLSVKDNEDLMYSSGELENGDYFDLTMKLRPSFYFLRKEMRSIPAVLTLVNMTMRIGYETYSSIVYSDISKVELSILLGLLKKKETV